MNSTVKTALLWVVIIVLVFLLWSLFQTTKGTSEPIAFSTFLDRVNSGYVDKVVIRGDDLLSSTPRQLLLYRALGLTPPEFVHVPLVVGPDGRRLAKRHGDTRLSALRQGGVRSEQLVGLLAWSCGWAEAPRPVSARALLPLFRLDTIPRGPFVLAPELLRFEEDQVTR